MPPSPFSIPAALWVRAERFSVIMAGKDAI